MKFAGRQASPSASWGFQRPHAGDVNPSGSSATTGHQPRNPQLQPLRPLRNPRVHAGDCGSGLSSEVPSVISSGRCATSSPSSCDPARADAARPRLPRPHHRLRGAHRRRSRTWPRTSFLLTEHNLYIRDTVNTQLERNMAKPHHHRRLPQLRAEHQPGPVTLDERAWSVWFLEMGRFCYPTPIWQPTCTPKALEEARYWCAHRPDERGRRTAQSSCPTVCSSSPWRKPTTPARRRVRILAEGRGHVWRFVFIARVVPVKGLTDLIRSPRGAARSGPGELPPGVLGLRTTCPEYYELCLRPSKKSMGGTSPSTEP